MASTDLEQVLLELINSARLDPLGDAARYITSYSPLQSSAANIQNVLSFFGVSGTLLLQQFTALMPAQPLAWNDQLATAARNHDQAMIAVDTQSHQLPEEPNFGARIANQGYNFTTAGENIFAFADDPLFWKRGLVHSSAHCRLYKWNRMDENVRAPRVSCREAGGK